MQFGEKLNAYVVEFGSFPALIQTEASRMTILRFDERYGE